MKLTKHELVLAEKAVIDALAALDASGINFRRTAAHIELENLLDHIRAEIAAIPPRQRRRETPTE